MTIDAAGCQNAIVSTIREGSGDYLMCVKGNQPKLSAGVERAFDAAVACDFEGVTYSQHASSETGHGRDEERSVTVLDAPADVSPDWRDAKAVVPVNRDRVVKGNGPRRRITTCRV